MEPPPRPLLREDSDSSSHSSQAVPEQRLRPPSVSATALSRTPPQGTDSQEDISPHTISPSTIFIQQPQLTVGSPDNLIPAEASFLPPRTDSPVHHTTASGRASPDELIYDMSRYQAVSPGSTNNPRTMSQVSPGFIFVNFLSQSVCSFAALFFP